jgi:hypothetical protein
MDTATAREDKADEQQAALYREQFKSLARLAPSRIVWLAFHRVIWSTDGTEVPEKSGGDNKTLALAAKGNIPANVQLMLNGHQHKFEVDAYVEDIPVTIVSGHGGDLLSPYAPTNLVGLVVNDMHIKAGLAKRRTFGFSMLSRHRSVTRPVHHHGLRHARPAVRPLSHRGPVSRLRKLTTLSAPPRRWFRSWPI